MNLIHHNNYESSRLIRYGYNREMCIAFKSTESTTLQLSAVSISCIDVRRGSKKLNNGVTCIIQGLVED